MCYLDNTKFNMITVIGVDIFEPLFKIKSGFTFYSLCAVGPQIWHNKLIYGTFVNNS